MQNLASPASPSAPQGQDGFGDSSGDADGSASEEYLCAKMHLVGGVQQPLRLCVTDALCTFELQALNFTSDCQQRCFCL